MKRLTSVAVALLVAAIIGSGCGPAATPEPTEQPTAVPEEPTEAPESEAATEVPPTPTTEEEASAGDERRGGVLHLFTSQTVGRIDPMVTQANYIQWLARQVHGQLVLYKMGTWEVMPDLAESWEVSEDGLTYTFYMRPDLTFHDGSPVQLSDVVFSLKRVRSDISVWKDYFDKIGSIEANSAENAIVIELQSPDPFLLDKLASIGGSVVYPEAAVDEYGDEFATTVDTTIGAGPFQMTKKSETELVLERFDAFPVPAFVDELSIRVIPDTKTQRLEFEAGNVDASLSILEASTAKRFEEDPEYEDHYKEFASPDRFWYGFNSTVEPFDDLRVRQAIARAIDREQAVNVYGLGGPSYTIIHPSMPGYHPDRKVYPRDLAEAKALLEEAGYGDGLEIELYVWNIPSFVAMTESIQANLAEAGIQAKLQTVEFGTFISEVRKGTYPFFINLANFSVPDPATLLYNSFHSEGPFTAAYEDEEVNELLEQARDEADREKRAELAAEAELIILEDAVAIPILNRKAGMVFQPWLHGIEDITPVYPHIRFNEIWLDPDHR